MREVLLAVAIAIAMAGGSSAPAGADTSDPAAEVVVTVSALRFDPAKVAVRRGVRVTFHNLSSSETLTVVSADGSLESWPLGEHGQWSTTLRKSGRYEFFVKEYPNVRGVADVQ